MAKSDEEMIANLLGMMIDRALANRELAQSTQRMRRSPDGFDIETQRKLATKKPKRRKISKYSKELGRQWKLVKKKSRKKNGDFKKGWDQKRELMLAHKNTRKKMK